MFCCINCECLSNYSSHVYTYIQCTWAEHYMHVLHDSSCRVIGYTPNHSSIWPVPGLPFHVFNLTMSTYFNFRYLSWLLLMWFGMFWKNTTRFVIFRKLLWHWLMHGRPPTSLVDQSIFIQDDSRVTKSVMSINLLQICRWNYNKVAGSATLCVYVNKKQDSGDVITPKR